MAADVDELKRRMVLFCLFFLALMAQTRAGLYTEQDPIVVLNSTCLTQAVVRSETAWMVEFYSSWCGHCVNFAPLYKQLAASLKGWKSVLQVGALDCAAQENTAICREYNISMFPTLIFFRPNSPDGTDGVAYMGTRSLDDIRYQLVNFIHNMSMENPPPTWPRLTPLERVDEIWGEVKGSVDHTALVFDEPGSLMGLHIILDLLDHKQLVLRRMEKANVLKFGLSDFPSVYLLDKDGAFQKIAAKKTKDELVQAIKRFLHLDSKAKGQDGRYSEEENELEEDDEEYDINVNTDSVHMQDLMSTIHYSFRQEVALHKVIQGPALDALKLYVIALAKFFPGIEPVMVFLGEMKDWIEFQTEPITADEWLKIIDGLQGSTAYLPSKLKWVACKGSRPKFRGYPCGLWTLFHTLSVNSEDRQHDLEVLQAMKGYIKHFFSCYECAENFGKMAATMEEQVSSHDDSILWLWQAHNMANKRLHGDSTEDPHHPKIQFPGTDLCRACWTTHRGQEVFDEKEVLEFLKSFYGRDNIVFDPDEVQNGGVGPFDRLGAIDEGVSKTEKPSLNSSSSNKNIDEVIKNKNIPAKVVDTSVLKRIQKLKLQEEETRHFVGSVPMSWSLSSVDLSMCVMFYVLCTFIIILIYFHFTVHRKMTCPNICHKR